MLPVAYFCIVFTSQSFPFLFLLPPRVGCDKNKKLRTVQNVFKILSTFFNFSDSTNLMKAPYGCYHYFIYLFLLFFCQCGSGRICMSAYNIQCMPHILYAAVSCLPTRGKFHFPLLPPPRGKYIM